jgi:protein tyrosine/serine phosphatase
MMNPRLSLLLVLALNVCVICTAGERGLPAQFGILNFGKVDEHLYRGAQPDAAGIRNLKALGIKLIVNLRMPGDDWPVEAAEALANGILYTNIPMSGVGRPKDEQVRQALAILETLSMPTFVHCQHGCDRTGTVVACYRIQHDHWSGEAALKEAERYGISKFEVAMKQYILAFGQSTKPESKETPSH